MRRGGIILFGVGSIAYGLVDLHSHHHAAVSFAHLAGLLKILGGLAILVPIAAGVGAALLGAAYLITTLSTVPGIIAAPLTYTSWGNAFEQISLLTGALLVFAGFSQAVKQRALQRAGRILIGVCSLSFGLEQAFLLKPTASLVPRWIPPNQLFWAYVTTAAFVLAAIALVFNRQALLAARLLTAMIALFGLLIWVPATIADQHNLAIWSECAETFAIAGATWILATLLARGVARRR